MVMAAKVEYAVKARRDDDFLVIARTGAVKNESFDAAVARGNLYREAGADLVMLMPATDAQWRDAPKCIDAPLATIASLDLRRPEAWRALGWSVVVDPFTAQAATVQVVQTAYRRFIAEGTTGIDAQRARKTYGTLAELAGLEQMCAIEDRTTERR